MTVKIKNSKEISKIYQTSDYSIFKKLSGNRPIDSHVKKIKDSMIKDGWIGAPITVNEKMEVIDGQHRLSAAQMVGIPVRYEIQPGLNLRKCQVMNTTSKKWTNANYVDSQIDLGNDDYKRLKDMIVKYPGIPETTKLTICSDNTTTQSGTKNEIFRNGKFKFSANRYATVNGILYELNKYHDMLSNIKGRVDCKYGAIHFALIHNKIDNDRLFTKVEENINRFNYVGATVDFLREISSVYNKSLPINKRVHLDIDWEEKGYTKIETKDLTSFIIDENQLDDVEEITL